MGEMSRIRPHMEVIGSDGVPIGWVERIDGNRIILSRDDAPDDVHLFLRLDDVDHTDEHVHLRQSSAELLGDPAPREAVAAPPPPEASRPAPATGARPARSDGLLPPIANPAVRNSRPRRNYYLPWVLVGLLLLGLIFALTRHDRGPTGGDGTTVRRQATLFGGETVTLPDGKHIHLRQGTLGYDVERFLASSDLGPRIFTFDKLKFDTGSAAVRDDDRGTIETLAQLLAAYPGARVQVIGYADARGSEPLNVRLGERRAEAVAGALMAHGVDGARLSAASGGEANPVGSNGTPGGRFENRRTELMIVK